MKKADKKVDQIVYLAEPKRINEEEDKQFVIADGDQFPNRLIGHAKMKLLINSEDGEIEKSMEKGTACRIGQNYFLTTSHNFASKNKKEKELNDLKMKFKDISYIKQGLGLIKGQEHSYVARFEIDECLPNPNFCKNIVETDQIRKMAEMAKKSVDEIIEELRDMSDFGLIKVKPQQGLEKEKYMPIVVLSQQAFSKKIQIISVFGYAVDFNKQKAGESKKSSVYINNLCGNSGYYKSFERNCIKYDIPTQEGTSGAPIMALYEGRWIIVGIHKGSDDNRQHVGVGSGEMIEWLNEMGYLFEKKPFVYTEKTLYLHENDSDFHARQILFLMDKGLVWYDMMVYSSYNLTNLRKILLSGNEIGTKGVEHLLRRKYPNLNTLFLTQNKINDLKQQEWTNVENLTTLGLNVNELKQFPRKLVQLKKLEKVWVNHNQIKEIDDYLIDFCSKNNRENLTVYIHTNNINLTSEENKAKQLGKLKTRIIWKKEG